MFIFLFSAICSWSVQSECKVEDFKSGKWSQPHFSDIIIILNNFHEKIKTFQGLFLRDNVIVNLFLHANPEFPYEPNFLLAKMTQAYFIDSKRFERMAFH